uniref:UPF0420 protein n=1 Tax=Columba livia TaxID=8932 RepID=R7VTD4_COLLI|nr:RUS1 family protein C16orf58 homolog [Columba livia]
MGGYWFVLVYTGSNWFVLVQRVLLPQGFPESVSSDYLGYQLWDALQALCSSLAGAVAARSVLQAVGVGDTNASVTGAALGWLLRGEPKTTPNHPKNGPNRPKMTQNRQKRG